MFAHFTKSGKCEWFQGGLVEFIHHYNNECGTSYTLTKCLDVERSGGATPKMPEVLLTDSKSGVQMVIERKSVVWPGDYIRKHENEHAFAEAVWQTAGGWYQDACYELIVSAPQMDKLNTRKKVMRVARDVSLAIDPRQGLAVPMGGSAPITWSFRRANFYEYEGRKGVVVAFEDHTFPGGFSEEVAIKGTASAMQKELSKASGKFRRYHHVLRAVLLDFYGTELSEDDIPLLMPMLAIPRNIDEIWMSKPEWISEDESDIGYKRLFKGKP